MIIIDQLFRFGNSITALYSCISFLVDQVYHFGYSVIITFNSLMHTFIDQVYHLGHYSVTAMSSWSHILIGAIAGFLIANLILALSSAISSRSAKKKIYNQSPTSEHLSIDTFIESIERSPGPSRSKPKPPLGDLELWAQELRQLADDANSKIINEIDDDPGETSLFAEDYISESEHNKALASLNDHIGYLIKCISKCDQLVQKSRSETIHAETIIDELRDEIDRFKSEKEQSKKVIENLQISHIEKGKLIDELRAQLMRSTYELSLEEPNSLHWSSQEQSLSHQKASSSENKHKAKDVMTYIPPNRRPMSQA